MTDNLKNPILGGFYPDPSICRAGDDFYLINSSMEMFPGIPISRSRDLVHWEQISYAMTNPETFHVTANAMSSGLMAPTIRYHDGVFYIINSNFCDAGNYIVTATDPAGPWSDPIWLSDVPGIDASLFFDDDGKCYVHGTGGIIEYPNGTKGRGIYVCEFDVKNMKTVGEKHIVWDSALRNAPSPEAPHLYKKDGWYYLMIAEGGTEHYHAITIARSRDIFGWYEGNPANPILTHRHLGFDYPICNVGHADLVELPNGDWYAVMLGSRIVRGYHKNMGRETFIVPIKWDRGWPYLSHGSGRVEWEYPAPDLPQTRYAPDPIRDHFDGDKLAIQWNFWGTPYMDFWKLEDSCIKLRALPRGIAREIQKINRLVKPIKKKDDNVSFIGRRQCHLNYTAAVHMRFAPKAENEAAGMIILQACNHQYRLERAMQDGNGVVRFVKVTNDVNGGPHRPDFRTDTREQVVVTVPYNAEEICFKVVAKEQDYSLYYAKNEGQWIPLYENADAREINPEVIGGLIGTYIGMFASSNGEKSDNWASFDWFDYEGSNSVI